jgi:hypothetical protein
MDKIGWSEDIQIEVDESELLNEERGLEIDVP